MEIAQHRPSAFALAFQPLRDMLVFSGRSTRTEVVGYFMLATLMNMVTVTVYGPGAPLLYAAKLAWCLLWGFPWIALFVRRLHDQDRPWELALACLAFNYVALPLMAVALGVPQPGDIQSSHWGALGWHYPTMRPLTVILLAIVFAAVLLQLALFLLPGTRGANRYGADPRGES